MDLEQLRALVMVVRHGSFTAAARRLSISQPGLSRRVARLEESLGSELLRREGGSVVPTLAGERVLAFAEDVLDRDDALRADLSAHRDDLAGHVSVASSTVPAEQVIPFLLAGFLDRHGSISVAVDVADTAEVVDAVLSRRVDLGFGGHAGASEGLVLVPIAEDEIVVALPAGHPLAGRETVDPAEIAGERHIVREAGSGTQRTIDEALNEAGVRVSRASPALALGSTQAVLGAVRAGLGVGLVSALAVRDAVGVAAVRLNGVTVRRSLYMMYESYRHRSPAAEALLGHTSAWGAAHR